MSIRKYLPFEKYVLKTTLSEEEVRRRLVANVEIRSALLNSLRWSSSHSKPYEGKFDGNTFKVSRIINYKNSFIPVIEGRISTFLNTTEIHIKMRLHTFVKVFTIIWLSGVSVGCIAAASATVEELNKNKRPESLPFMFIPFLMLAFGGVLFTVPFKIESKRSRKFFKDLLEGEETNDADQ